MADIRHCDHSGCSGTEPVEDDRFLKMSGRYPVNPLRRFCSWACLVADATKIADAISADQAEMRAYFDEVHKRMAAVETP